MNQLKKPENTASQFELPVILSTMVPSTSSILRPFLAAMLVVCVTCQLPGDYAQPEERSLLIPYGQPAASYSVPPPVAYQRPSYGYGDSDAGSLAKIPVYSPQKEYSYEKTKTYKHKHSHSHHHKHQHDHSHKHKHGHAHDHLHKHGHGHEHGHKHAHQHDEKHGHYHSHGHKHGHGHEHGHKHNHGHDHGHEHKHYKTGYTKPTYGYGLQSSSISSDEYLF